MEKKKIIIDTDPGIGDAMAILFALAHPRIELLGLTTVYGNVPTDMATINALRILEAGGADLPVCEGDIAPLSGEPRAYAHLANGKDGLGDISWPKAKLKDDGRAAVDFIAQTVNKHPGEVTLVATGPLTNIARVIVRRPEVVGLISEVVVAGGAAFCPGDVTPLAEANVGNDPEAADIVFGASWKVVMVGMDATSDVVINKEHVGEIAEAQPPYGQLLAGAAGHCIDYFAQSKGVQGCFMHDACAVAHVAEPQLFNDKKARIRVVCNSIARGKTAIMPDGFDSVDHLWTGRPLQTYSDEIDKAAMLDMFVATLGRK